MESTGLMRVGVGGSMAGVVGFMRPVSVVALDGSKKRFSMPGRSISWSGGRLTATRRNLGWESEEMNALGVVLIAARAFGVGSRGPARPRITTPRRSVQEEESDDSQSSVDLRNDVNQGIVEVLDGDAEGPISEDSANKSAQLLQDQFNRFAAAVALADRKMAEDIIREMGDGESTGVEPLDLSDIEDENTYAVNGFEDSEQVMHDQLYHLQNSTTTERNSSEEILGQIGQFRYQDANQPREDPRSVEKQLEELYEEVGRMIEEGDEEIAREVIEANYEALSEQLEEGIRGVEQGAMLDILAQLYMDMGDYDCAEVLLDQVFLHDDYGCMLGTHILHSLLAVCCKKFSWK